MADAEQPQEPEETIYQRDKTAPEPKVPEKPDAEKPKRPVIKPRKIFKAKKVKIDTSKALEHRVRHILLSAKDSADLLRQTLLDYQKELADQPMDNPDKEIQDREKFEKFFSKFARKYSACPTRLSGGDLDWIYADKPEQEGVLTRELRDGILQCEKFVIPEPIRSKLGHHVILICDTKISKRVVEKDEGDVDPRYQALMDKDRPRIQAPGKDMDIPS